jgi:hypothetical protein
MPRRRSQQPRVQAQRATSRLVRVKGTYVDPVLWTKLNLKLVMENKTLQQWAQEAIEELGWAGPCARMPGRSWWWTLWRWRYGDGDLPRV